MLTLPGLLRNFLKGNRPYVLFLVLLNLFFFGDVLFTDKTFFYRDIGNFHHPLRKLVTEAYSRGEWPLWNPYVQFGQPLLANPNAMAVYPTQILFHVLPFAFAFDLNLVLHCLLGGLGAFFLARALNLSPLAALAAAVAYNFNGVILSLINVPLLAAIGSLFPWLALLLQRIIRRPSPANLAGFSALFGLLLLLLEPLTTYAVCLFLVPFGLYSFLVRPAGASSWRIGVGLLVAVVSGFCLAAVQILPTLELFQNSSREKGLPFESVSSWSVHPFSLAQMLFPHVWKDTFALTGGQSSSPFGFFGTLDTYIVSCYAGLACLMLALLALFFSKHRALTWILFSVSVVALVLALGQYTPAYSLLFHYLPPFRLGRYPAKYLLTTALCLSLLTGLGVDLLAQLKTRLRESGGRSRLILFVLSLAAVLIGSGLLSGAWLWEAAGFRVVDNVIKMTYHGEAVDLSQALLRHSILYLWLVLAAGLLIVFFASTGRPRRASWVPILATLLIFLDLLSNHLVNPLIPSDVYAVSPVAEWLVSQTPTERMSRVYHLTARESPYRILGKTDSFIWNFVFRRLTAAPYTAVDHHVQYSSFMPIDRLETLASELIDSQLRQTQDLGRKLDYLARLNTGFILSMNPVRAPQLEEQASFDLNSDRSLHIYRLRSAVPRAYLSGAPANLAPGSYSFDPEESSSQPAEVKTYQAGVVHLTAAPRKPSMLVLLDSYYPGWRVWVDGSEKKIEIVNRGFRGVRIEAGKHEVTFRYDPDSFRYGLAITLSTIAAWVLALIFAYWPRRREIKEQGAL